MFSQVPLTAALQPRDDIENENKQPRDDFENEINEVNFISKKYDFIKKRALHLKKCDYIPARFQNYDV